MEKMKKEPAVSFFNIKAKVTQTKPAGSKFKKNKKRFVFVQSVMYTVAQCLNPWSSL